MALLFIKILGSSYDDDDDDDNDDENINKLNLYRIIMRSVKYDQ